MSIRSIRRRRPSAVPCTSDTSSRIPTPMSSHASSACVARPCPMGWDDNGLPTERRVQNYFGVRCDPSLPYGEFRAPGKPGKRRFGLASELHRALHASDRGRREGLRAPVAPSGAVGGLVDDLRNHRPTRAAHLATRIPASAETRRRLSARGADAVGRRLPHGGRPGGARRSRDARGVPQDPVRSTRSSEASWKSTRPVPS